MFRIRKNGGFVRGVVIHTLLLSLVVVTPRISFGEGAGTGNNSDPALGATHQNLLAQEEALLKQLTGGNQKYPTTASSSSPIITAPSETSNNARNVTTSIPSATELSDVEDVVSVAQKSDPKVEELIDQQARAALAAIADVKERVAASKANSPIPAADVMPDVSFSSDRPSRVSADSFVENPSKDETALSRVTHLSKELGSRDSELSNVKQELSSASRKAIAAEGRASALAKQVEALRAKLMVAETEVERLSRMIEARNRQVIQQANSSVTFARGAAPIQNAAPAMNGGILRERVIVREGKAAEDLPVAVVTSDKANLRTGPGQDNSSLMAVTRGNRLVIETKQGSWYRVFTPNGVRAWVSADNVEVQRGGGAL